MNPVTGATTAPKQQTGVKLSAEESAMLGVGLEESWFQKLFRGVADLDTISKLELGLNKEQQEKIYSYLHLVSIALRMDRSIFESHARAFGRTVDTLPGKLKEQYEQNMIYWDQINGKANEWLNDPYPALKEWMEKLNITPEMFSESVVNPFKIDQTIFVENEILRRMSILKLINGLKVPEEYNGLGLSHKEYVAVLEGMARLNSMALATDTSVQGTIAYAPVGLFGNEEQKTKLLGKRAAFALTEEGSGSDALGSMKTEAVDKGDYYEITGSKIFITNTHIAEVMYVGAKVPIQVTKDGQTKTIKVPTVFIVELDPPFSLDDDLSKIAQKREQLKAKGLDISDRLPLSTIRGTYQAQIQFNSLRVPKANVLGKIGDGAAILFGSLTKGRAAFAGFTTEGAVQMFDQTRKRLNARPLRLYAAFDKEGGGRLSHHPFIQTHIIGPMAAQVAGMRAVAELATAYIDELADKNINVRDVSAYAKSYCSEGLEQVAYLAHRVHGGSAFMEGHLNGIDLAYRDSKIPVTVEGQDDLMDQYGTGIGVQSVANDGLTIQKYWIGVIKWLKSFGAKENKVPREEYIKARNRLLGGLLSFSSNRGEFSKQDAKWLNRRALSLAFKTMQLGAKYGDDMKNKPVELSRMAKIAQGIFAVAAAQNKLNKQRTEMPEPVVASLERFIELEKQRVDKHLIELKPINEEDARNQELARAWIAYDAENPVENNITAQVDPYDGNSFKITNPYEY